MMIALDTDVMAIYFLFKWDKRYDEVNTVISLIDEKYTTIYNILELVGLTALAQGGSKALELYNTLHRMRDFKILYWKDYPKRQSSFISMIIKYIKRGLSVGDAIIAWILEEYNVDILITYNIKHFKNKVLVNITAPSKYLENIGKNY